MYRGKKVGLGLCCYERPDFSMKAITSVFEVLDGVLDETVINDDASTPGSYDDMYTQVASWNWTVKPLLHRFAENSGVGASKSYCMETLVNLGCDYIFLMEDDMTVVDVRAVTGYIDKSIETGIEHFNFAYHGPMNMAGPIEVTDQGVEVHIACVGAWSFMTRNAIETVGLMDPTFYNAWEHCEWTARAGQAGLTLPFWRFADVQGAIDWIKPQGDHTVIARNERWLTSIHEGRAYWIAKDETTWPRE